VSDEETGEFLKLMKHNEYSVVKSCQDILNVSYPEFQALLQCIANSVERGIYAPTHGPKD